MFVTRRLRFSRAIVAGLLLAAFVSVEAQASGSGMPWEEPLQKVLESV
jgi:type IV secretion system protein VirB2